MRILFISSGNKGEISPITKNQGDSLMTFDSTIKIEYALIRGRGIWGYLKNTKSIRRVVKQFKPDLIHAHYSFSGILAVLAFVKKPIITSLMGSDIRLGKLHTQIIRFMAKFFWNKTIVKSEDMKKKINISDAYIIPNGVNTNIFSPISKNEAREKLNWPLNEKIILFAADSNRKEKNWKLAEEALKLMKLEAEAKFLNNISFNEVVYYYNAADVILLTSLWEGSPNVIKEAMACNKPIVCTNVGDVKWLFSNTDGNYVTEFDHQDVSTKLTIAIDFSQNITYTQGRKRLFELGLDSESVAQRIIDLYYEIIRK
jgi:teichuronic acid biosynthesis glycosyltransferase TuaC